MSVGKSSMGWDGKPFWGLVVQQGPWKSTASDIARAAEKDNPSIGGGIPFGGRAHAGAASFKSVMTPAQIDASGPVPEPSLHALGAVMNAPSMKRQGTRGGLVKNGLTLGARTPLQTGHKMGNAPGEASPIRPGSPIQEQPPMSTAPFMSTHHIEDVGTYGTVSALPYYVPIKQEESTLEYKPPIFDQISKALEASTSEMDQARKQVMTERAKGIIRRELRKNESSQYLESARKALGKEPAVTKPSFRYKKSFEPKLKPIKEVRTAREQGGPAIKPIRPEMRGVPGTSRLAEQFYTTEVPAKTPAKRGKKGTAVKDKRLKLAPLSKIPKKDVQIKLRIGERSEKKRSSTSAQRTEKGGKKVKLAPFEK